MQERANRASFEDFVGIIDRLRSPGGCPWDLEQTHMSLRQATIEEAYEVVHAIESGDAANLKEELGDILLHVVFHSDIAKRAGTFTIDDVIEGVAEKMIRRHPHVFADAKAGDAETVLRNWEELKKQERAAKGAPAPMSILEAVHSNVPALMEAQALSEKAAKVGFDWKTADDVKGKIDEEFAEIEAVLAHGAAGERQARLEEEFGDLLFAVINFGRKLGVDSEIALRAVNRKFRARFASVEEGLRAKGMSPKEATLDEMETLWQAAKKERP